MNTHVANKDNTFNNHNQLWKYPIVFWVVICIALAVVAIPFSGGLDYMFDKWFSKEEYSHAVLLPFIAVFLLWQKKDIFSNIQLNGSWLGFVVTVLGFGIYTLGNLATLYTIIQYALILVLMGWVLALMGVKNSRHVMIPMFLLFLAIPLPNFLYQALSAKLQLWSSAIGVEVIRAFGISVYLQGNVIDLGNYKLQVVEACNGLRYLFPLMTLGFVIAYFFKAPFWQRAIVFISAIPITVFMNSFRIGVIGVMVEYWGQSMAEGFLHDFEGWVIFMACTVLMLGEVALFVKLGKEKRSFNDALNIQWPDEPPKDATIKNHQIPVSFYATIALSIVLSLALLALDTREERQVPRQSFDTFPMTINDWVGFRGRMDPMFINVLKFNDYIVADYHNSNGNKVEFYSAFYDSQRSGTSIHSPKSCLPADGWAVTENEVKSIKNIEVNGKPLNVNRVVIEKHGQKQLVYYWFQQRGRTITNEFAAKWYLFVDSLFMQRTDGALLRIITPVPQGQKVSEADKTIVSFLNEIKSELPLYIPN